MEKSVIVSGNQTWVEVALLVRLHLNLWSVVSAIVDLIRESSPDGGFVRKEEGHWVEVGMCE
jgi:hypothetical protein